jgi:hypothetical protein
MPDELVFNVQESRAVPATPISLAEAGLSERQHLQEWVLSHPEMQVSQESIYRTLLVQSRGALRRYGDYGTIRVIYNYSGSGPDQDHHGRPPDAVPAGGFYGVTVAPLGNPFETVTLVETTVRWNPAARPTGCSTKCGTTILTGQ